MVSERDRVIRPNCCEEIAQLARPTSRGSRSRCGELDRLAHLDPLVPIANRRGLMRELETMIARHERHGSPAAVLFVDLDGLKMLNDSFGHEGGDAALIHVAEQLLARRCAPTDCVARLGGDEFCILLDHADEASAIETAGRLANLVAGDDFLFDGQPVPLSVAIGLTVIERGDTPTAVLARADQAMYRVESRRLDGCELCQRLRSLR